MAAKEPQNNQAPENNNQSLTQRLKNYRMGIVLAIIIAAAVGFGFFQITHDEPPQTYEPSVGSIAEVVQATGNINSAGTLDVYTTANGVITEMYVQNGQTVEAETELFKITSTASPQEKEAAEAAYLTAIDEYNTAEQNKILYQAQLEEARASVLGESDDLSDFLNRTDNPDAIDKDIAFSEDWSARKRFDNAEKKFIDAEQTLQAKSQNIAAKKAALNATKDQVITSPVQGTVANIDPKRGDEVFIVTSTKAEPVLTLSNFDTYTVDVNITEKDIYRIALGQPAEVRIESFPDNPLTGTVTKVDTIGEVDNGVVTYTVTVDLDNSDIRMRAGMTADVHITTQTKNSALLIPNAALDETPDGKVVYVAEGSTKTHTTRNIKVGLKDEEYTEVISGLDGSETLLDPLSVRSSENQ